MTRQGGREQVQTRRKAQTWPERPVPDEAPLEESGEVRPARRRASGLTDLSMDDWLAIVKRAGKRTIDDNMPMIAQALAYSAFMAIPAVLLVVVGVFSLFVGPETITNLMDRFGSIMPQQATQLLGESLTRLSSHPSAGITMTIVGFALAIWSTTGAMTSFMAGLNIAYDRDESRGFVRKRLVAAAMAACIGAAFLLVAVLLIFGPTIEHYVAQTVGLEGVLGYVWWAAQWPILMLGLLAAFATLLYIGPDVEQPRWRFLTIGTIAAVLVWLVVSGAFAFYTSHFGSYNKAWGSLAAVVVMLVWLWLTSLALLFGGELNAEVERCRKLGGSADRPRR
jgi:membrane protein